MLRVLLRSYGEVAARSSATEASLPQLATSFESLRRFSGYDEGSKTGKGEYGDVPGLEVPGDTENVAPSHFRGGDTQVAGVPSGVSARPSQPHEEEDTPPNMDPPDNEPHTQKLSKDPHEADIPDYPGINPKNQAEADAKDPRREPRGSDKAEKPPGNWPGMKTDRLSGDFPEDVPASTQRSGGDNTPPADVKGGPTGGQFTEETDIKDVADPAGIKWGEKPDAPVDPKTAYQNR